MMNLDCYFNFCENEDGLADNEMDPPVPIAQVDIMGTVLTMETIPTYLLSQQEIPVEVRKSIPQDKWSQFAASVESHSNQMLHHKSIMMDTMYFGVLISFVIILTVINLKVSNVALCATLLTLCLVILIGFVIMFNHLPTWHDEGLDEKIMEILELQPFAEYGYILDYLRQTRSESLMGTSRLIRIFGKEENDEAYKQPELQTV